MVVHGRVLSSFLYSLYDTPFTPFILQTLITQDESTLPFDLRHRRYIKYENTIAGAKQLKEDLRNAITNILSRQ
jgi:hypothetical protein